MIANIALDDALIQPHRANPTGLNFRERQALERRNHWEKTSHFLLVGAILHVLYAERDKTLAGVANFIRSVRDVEWPIVTRHLRTVTSAGARDLRSPS
jgi:type IV secretion system protein VirD4